VLQWVLLPVVQLEAQVGLPVEQVVPAAEAAG